MQKRLFFKKWYVCKIPVGGGRYNQLAVSLNRHKYSVIIQMFYRSVYLQVVPLIIEQIIS